MEQIIYIVRNVVETPFIEEYTDWQNTEHVPWILTTKGYESVQRFALAGQKNVFANLWHVQSVSAYDSRYKQALSHSPWSLRLRRHRTFRTDFYRQLLDVSREGTASCMALFSFDKTLCPIAPSVLGKFAGAALSDTLFRMAFYENIRGGERLQMIAALFTRPFPETEREVSALREKLLDALGLSAFCEEEIYNSLSGVLTAEDFERTDTDHELIQIIKDGGC